MFHNFSVLISKIVNIDRYNPQKKQSFSASSTISQNVKGSGATLNEEDSILALDTNTVYHQHDIYYVHILPPFARLGKATVCSFCYLTPFVLVFVISFSWWHGKLVAQAKNCRLKSLLHNWKGERTKCQMVGIKRTVHFDICRRHSALLEASSQHAIKILTSPFRTQLLPIALEHNCSPGHLIVYS